MDKLNQLKKEVKKRSPNPVKTTFKLHGQTFSSFMIVEVVDNGELIFKIKNEREYRSVIPRPPDWDGTIIENINIPDRKYLEIISISGN
jgi:hypothetical protein